MRIRIQTLIALLVMMGPQAQAQTRAEPSPMPCMSNEAREEARRPPHDVEAGCRLAAARLTRLFQLPLPRGEVIVTTSTGYSGSSTASGFVMNVPDSLVDHRARQRLGSQSTIHSRAMVVPHEIAHTAVSSLIHRIGGNSPISDPSRRVPEWFGEAVAVYAEPLETRLQRVRGLRSSPSRLALRANAFREHPVRLQANYRRREIQTDPPCAKCGWSRWRKVVVTEQNDGRVTTDTTFYATRDLLNASDSQLEAPDFYPTSLVLLALIHHETGAKGVRNLLESCLTESKRGTPINSSDCGIPWRSDVLQQKWNAWLARPAADDTLLAGGPDPALTPRR